jgi:hypothetical protein
MPKQIKHKSGAIEYIDTQEEKDIKKVFKKTKAPIKLTKEEVEELLFLICKKLNIL